jgi:hypothetical protein
MRQRFAGHVSLFTLSLAFAVVPCAWGQQQTGRAAGRENPNSRPAAAQNNSGEQNRNAATPATETIRGVISGITTEGELVLDYRTNSVARAEGAFLAIVASPTKSEASHTERTAPGSTREEHAASGKKRHNIYIAWLTPRTKICEATEKTGSQHKNEHATESSGETKDIGLDQLEVGDHVEVQFSPQEESAANNNVHQNQQLRQTHGRHRTFVGYATSITVLPAKEHEKSHVERNTGSEERSRKQ